MNKNQYTESTTFNFTMKSVNGVMTKVFDNQKVVKNLMSGKDVVIEKATPLCCDPSSETFWSM